MFLTQIICISTTKTGKDLKINHPDKYEQWLERELCAFAAGGTIHHNSTRTQIDEALMRADFVTEPSAELQAELIRRLAPFHIAEHAFEKGVAAGSMPDYPLAAINQAHPKRGTQAHCGDLRTSLWRALSAGSPR